MENIRVLVADPSGDLIKKSFAAFLRSYNVSNGEINSTQGITENYISQLATMVSNAKTTLYVDFLHVMNYNIELADAIEHQYYRFESYLRAAVLSIVTTDFPDPTNDYNKTEYFIAFYNLTRIEKIRALKCSRIGRLVSIGGTVTRTSEVKPELLYGYFICKKCQTVNDSIEQFYQFTPPHVCKSTTCTSHDFQLIQDQSIYVDWQRLRIQENPNEIPAGSMPRCMDVICRNEVVELAKAGDKMIFTGMLVVIPDTSGSKSIGDVATSGKVTGRGDSNGGVTGLKQLGVKEMTYRTLFIASSILPYEYSTTTSATLNTQKDNYQIDRIMNQLYTDTTITTSSSTTTATGTNNNNTNNMNTSMSARASHGLSEADVADVISMFRNGRIYSKLAESLCPSVFGHGEVKRGVLLMLFGGVHKKTAEGISLRGDINVCIVGDPSCAKSQFLKYVHGFLPHTVYTSGKSSSAAGLTASVVRDPDTGEHCIEAGALMLADNGICCIDEFDKMDPMDQVAIHEAMEQQSISITKAGIQATLNARTSILAAANPVFGRYDRTKTLKANVAITPAIMSRFDLFFVILDECNPVTDEAIARHIIHSHRNPYLKDNKSQVNATTMDTTTSTATTTTTTPFGVQNVPYTTEQIQKYIKFAKSIHPKITSASRKELVRCYRSLRENDTLGKNKTAYRITVRQLESLIRLSEALARVHLSKRVDPPYVIEAFRLLKKSIIFVESEDIELEDNEEQMERLGEDKDIINSIINDDNDNNDDDNDQGPGPGNNMYEDNSNNEGEDDEEYSSSSSSGDHNNDNHNENKRINENTRKRKEKDTTNIIGNKDFTTVTTSTNLERTDITTDPQLVTSTTTTTTTSITDIEPPVQKKAKKSVTATTQISAKKYEEASQLIVLYLKKMEDKATRDMVVADVEEEKEVDNVPSSVLKGTLWRDVTTKYIEEDEDLNNYLPSISTESSINTGEVTSTISITKEKHIEMKRKLVNQIIKRMIKYDEILYIVNDTLDEKSLIANEEKYILIHPSYVIV